MSRTKKIFSSLFSNLSRKLSGKGFFKYRIVRRVYHYLKKELKPDYVEIFGNKIFLDKKDSMNLSIIGSDYEKLTTDYIRKEVKEGDIIIDVGANIGLYTMLFANLVGKSGKVFAFEPEKNNFELLTKNIEVNGYQNIIAINQAISNKMGRLNLNITENSSAMHYLSEKQLEENAVSVDVNTLDEYFRNLKYKIKLCKMDVEGSEMLALKGMSEIIEKTNNLQLIIEFNLETMERGGIRPNEFIEFLKNKKFDMYDIDNNMEVPFPISEEWLSRVQNGTNLLCKKNEP